MINTFRFISLIEGISYLIILSVTLNLISREFVFALGMTHGILFIVYLVFSLIVCSQQNWSLKIWLPLFLASIIPLAFIPVELFLKKASARQKASAA